ncbi:hypothetical protein HK104_005592, partial [Borealophlyctis nickersoniae]
MAEDAASTLPSRRNDSQYDSTVTDFEIGNDGDDDDTVSPYGDDHYDDEYDIDIDDEDEEEGPPSRASVVLDRAAIALQRQLDSVSQEDGIHRRFASNPVLSDPYLFRDQAYADGEEKGVGEEEEDEDGYAEEWNREEDVEYSGEEGRGSDTQDRTMNERGSDSGRGPNGTFSQENIQPPTTSSKKSSLRTSHADVDHRPDTSSRKSSLRGSRGSIHTTAAQSDYPATDASQFSITAARPGSSTIAGSRHSVKWDDWEETGPPESSKSPTTRTPSIRASHSQLSTTPAVEPPAKTTQNEGARPRRIHSAPPNRRKLNFDVNSTGIEFMRLPAVEGMAAKLYEERRKEEDHWNKLLLLRLTNPWSAVTTRQVLESSIGRNFNVPQ